MPDPMKPASDLDLIRTAIDAAYKAMEANNADG